MNQKSIQVNEFEVKIKADIEAALALIKDISYKDQLLVFLMADLEELQKIHVEIPSAEE